jgi:hypothetical protein
MSVVSGENLEPPIFSKSFGDNLYSYDFASPTVVATLPSETTFSLGTLPAGNYIIYANLVVTQSAPTAQLSAVFNHSGNNINYAIYNTYINLNGSPAFYGTTQTYQYTAVFSFGGEEELQLVMSNTGAGTLTLLPNSSGTFFQAVQTSEN